MRCGIPSSIHLVTPMLHPKEEPKSYCNEVQDAQFLGVERLKAEAT